MKILSNDVPNLVEQSYTDYIVTGLDRICLGRDSIRRIEVFIARPDHELWKNSIGNKGLFLPPLMPCPTRWETSAIYGKISLIVQRQLGWACSLDQFIVLDDSSFEKTGRVKDFALAPEPMGRHTEIPAGQHFSVYVPKNERAAWFSYLEEYHYPKPRAVYTNHPLEKPLQLRKKMSRQQFYTYLGMLGIKLVETA